jgi:hypothetical protein
MLRRCAIHRDTSRNWMFGRLRKCEWSGWQNATNYSRSIAELLLHFAKSLAFTSTSQVSLVHIHNPTDLFDATRHTKIDIWSNHKLPISIENIDRCLLLSWRRRGRYSIFGIWPVDICWVSSTELLPSSLFSTSVFEFANAIYVPCCGFQLAIR